MFSEEAGNRLSASNGAKFATGRRCRIERRGAFLMKRSRAPCSWDFPDTEPEPEPRPEQNNSTQILGSDAKVPDPSGRLCHEGGGRP